VLILILAVLLIAFFPFSASHFFSPSHPDVLFMISHASQSHLAMNIIALLLVWLMAQKTGESEARLIGVFFATSLVPLFIPLMFAQPIIGASAGVYGMIGYLLPDLIGAVPLPVSYTVLLPMILFEDCFMCNPWSKLFHVFGLTLGVVFRYMFDVNSISLKRTAMQLNLGTDYYSLLSLGYPHGYVAYKAPGK
jgi:membrane associated rhomboid family serine protease